MQSFFVVLIAVCSFVADGLPSAYDRFRRQADEYQFGSSDDAIIVETLGTPTTIDAGNLTERFGYGFQTTFQGWQAPPANVPNYYGYPAGPVIHSNNYYPSYNNPYGPPNYYYPTVPNNTNYYDYNNGGYYYYPMTTTTTTARPTTTTTRPPYGNFYAFYFRDSGALNETDFRSPIATDDGFNFGSL